MTRTACYALMLFLWFPAASACTAHEGAVAVAPAASSSLSTDAMLSLYQARKKAYDNKDVDAFMATMHPEGVIENVTLGTRSVGAAEVRERVARELSGLPTIPIEETGWAFGDNLMVITGKSKLPRGSQVMGSPSTAGEGALEGVIVLKFRDGLIAEEQAYVAVAKLVDGTGLSYAQLREHASKAVE